MVPYLIDEKIDDQRVRDLPKVTASCDRKPGVLRHWLGSPLCSGPPPPDMLGPGQACPAPTQTSRRGSGQHDSGA